MHTPWEHRFAQRTQRMESSVIREILKVTQQPDVISFAGGLPSPDVFPIQEFQDACDVVLNESGKQALQYGTTEGYLPLREMISRYQENMVINVSPENILITSGSQQAMDLLGKVFINNGDRILVESPTFLGAIQSWNAYNAQFVPVPTDEHGMITEELEKALRIGPKFIYVLPNFQNPTGVTLSLERRKELIRLANQYGVPIVEDDPYVQLRFEGETLPSIVELDGKQNKDNGSNYSGNVIYMSTFSKTLAPGLRLAWVVAPEGVIRKLTQAKQGVDLHTSTFVQYVAYNVASGGFLSEHINTIVDIYRKRRDIMLQTMEECFPEEVNWTKPEGGLFLWVTLPEYLDSAELLKKAVEQKVAFVPGAPFYPADGGHNTMRLNFSNASEDNIREGIQRLGKVFKQAIADHN